LQLLSDGAHALMDVPHAATRRPTYVGALKRHICSIFLALEIANGTTPQERKERVALMDIALRQADTAMCRDRPDIDTGHWSERLASTCAQLMSRGDCTDHRRSWALDTRLPPFVRALACWSNAEEVRQNAALASDFFELATKPDSEHDLLRALHRVLLVLDCALAHAAERNSHDTALRIIALWSKAYEQWRELIPTEWSRIHLKIYVALMKPGWARERLLADPVGFIRSG
jgi:hypothetical protein